MIGNLTTAFVEPVASVTSFIFATLSYLVGGIFGLYVIFLILKWFQGRKVAKSIYSMNTILKDIDNRVMKLEKKPRKKKKKKKKKKKS